MYTFYFLEMLVFMGALQCLHNIRFSFGDYSDLKHSLIHTIFVYCVLSPLFWRREMKRICHHKYTNVHKKNNCTSSFSVLWQQATSVQVLYHHLLWHRGNGKKNKWFMRWCIINKISIFHFKYHGYRQYPCITTHLA